MNRNTTLITVICYNSIEFWKSRKRAIDFYREAARFCNGCEAKRYTNIVRDLMDGKAICHDGCSYGFEHLHEKNQYHQFPNGTNIRDAKGKREWPTDTYGLLPKMTIVK